MSADRTTDRAPPGPGGKDEHANKRGSPRHRVLKGGRITFNENYSSFEVLIRDMSDHGARLKLDDPWIVPNNFNLVILNPNTGVSETRPCERRWQRGVMVGLRFLDPVAPDRRAH